MMNLVALIEEEFGQTFDLEEAAEWTSYEQVRAALSKRLEGWICPALGGTGPCLPGI